MVRKLKALNAPKFWKIAKKKTKWVVSPSPGPHKKFECIPLSIILRNILKIAETRKEAKRIINNGDVLVDNDVVKDSSYPVGLFDTVSLPKTKKHYRIVPTEKGLELVEINANEAKVKLCKIKNKTILKRGKIQLNLNDGKNILTESKDYKTGDSLLLEVPSLKISKHMKFMTGAKGVVIKGGNSGKIGIVKSIIESKISNPPRILCEIGDASKEVLKDRFFVLGENQDLTVNVNG